MPALKYDLVVEQGADYQLTIPVLGLDGGGTLSGWAASGQIRESFTSATVLHQFDLTLTGANVVLRIPAAASSGWSWRRGRYSVELVAPDGKVTRLVEGSVVVSPEITRV